MYIHIYTFLMMLCNHTTADLNECKNKKSLCLLQALCLHRGGRGVGGATPGKKAMGLRVVRCSWLVPTLNNQVLVFPATDLG